MSGDEFLFPVRSTRRDFLKWSSLATAGALVAGSPQRSSAAEGVILGSGDYRYQLVPDWGKLPEGMSYGFGCAIAVDSQDRIFVTSRSQSPCVAIFSKDGGLLETWSQDFAEKVGYTTEQVIKTAHGLYISKEPDGEFLYFTENAPGKRIYKTDLQGKILFSLGAVPQSSTSLPFDLTNPTDVAVAPNGDIYVVDGYGSQLVHRFDKNFEHLKTIGGRGQEHGKFNVCHGVWVSTLNKEPEVYIADRANNRLEVFSPDLTYLRTIEDFRLPCCFYQQGGLLFVPELGARVSIVDAHDGIVARLGDGAAIQKENIASHPEVFAAPHALTVDSAGDLYVIEWLPFGRPRKFRRVVA